jgi:hypothetical protein
VTADYRSAAGADGRYAELFGLQAKRFEEAPS